MPDADGYQIEDLERWQAKARDNIARFREAIEREEHQIAWAQQIIDDLKRRQETADGGTG